MAVYSWLHLHCTEQKCASFGSRRGICGRRRNRGSRLALGPRWPRYMWREAAFFIFLYFSKSFFTKKNIFGFTIYRFVPLPPDRGRQTPTPNIKAEVPPGPPTHAFAANNIHRGKKGETWSEGGSCNSETLLDSALVICR